MTSIMFVTHENIEKYFFFFGDLHYMNWMILCFLNLVEHICEFEDSGRIKYDFACKWNIIGHLKSLIFI